MSGTSSLVTITSRTLRSTGVVNATSFARSGVMVMSPAAMSPSPASKAGIRRSRETGDSSTVTGRAPVLNVVLIHFSRSSPPFAAVP